MTGSKKCLSTTGSAILPNCPVAPSRFCPGACPLHPLYYPSSLHHQPSQLESPLLCWRHSTTSQRLTRKHPLCSENHICYSDIKNWTTQNKLQLNSEKNRSNAPWNKTRTVFYFCQYPSAWQYHSPSLRLCQKPQVFSSTARCPWKTSSVKPPNPAITSSVELVCLEVSFHWGHSETGHLTHSVMPWLLQFSPFWLAFFLCPQPSSHNCAAQLIVKKRKTNYITPLFEFLHWLPIQQRI